MLFLKCSKTIPKTSVPNRDCWWLVAIGKHQGVTPFASQPITSSPTWIISSSTCAVFFPCVRRACTTSCLATTTWSKEGSQGLYHQRRTIRLVCVQTTREPALLDPKRKNSSVDFCWFSFLSLIWSLLLLFAVNVLMLLVGVNGTPGSDYLSAPLTNSILDM